MATAPERVRRALRVITGAAGAEVRAVAQAAPRDPASWRAALFATVPLIVSEYAPAASTLALDWFDEIRAEAAPRQLFTPSPRLLVTDADVAATVARTTEALRDAEFDALVEEIMAEAEANLEAELQRQVAAGFRDTITGNAADDPEAAGWKRFAQQGACKFCVMLAARGAVFTEATARFAAHTDCNCIAGPKFGGKEIWAEATPMQYLASRRKRSEADRARLRDYLNQNFPDAPG